MQTPILIVLVAYTLMMLMIGYYFYRKNDSMADYFLGGRSLNPYVTALSAQASDMSGWLLLGLPGAVYAGGFNAMWIGIGLVVGTYLNWQFTARRLRQYTEIVNAITLADFFEHRFKDQSRVLRVVSSLVILVFFTIYVGSGLVAGGVLFNNIFGIDYTLAVLLSLVVVGIYTVLGGFLAVSWTDFIQGMLMFVALLVTPAFLIAKMGGFEALWASIGQTNPDLLNAAKVVQYSFAEQIKWSTVSGGRISFIEMISLLGWGLGYFGMPHILVRFMGIRSAKEMPIAQLIGITWVVISLIGAIFVGVIGIAVLEPLNNPETVFLTMTQQFFNPWLTGIFLAAVLAAIMSTIDSQLLVSSSALTEDFYKSLFRPNAGQKELLWVSRATVLLVMGIGLVIALAGGTVLDIVAYAWAGLGAAFGPTVLFALYWKKMTRNGALAGVISGGLTVVFWKNIFGYTGLYEIIPGFIISSLLILLVSSLGKGPDAEIEREFDLAKMGGRS